MNYSLLYADDDLDDQESFEYALKSIPEGVGSSAKYFIDGESLLKNIFNTQTIPDIVFLDLNMPRMNGFECLKQLRSYFHTNVLPIVILTTSRENEMIKKAYELGANHYAIKCGDFKCLESTLQSCLAQIFEKKIEKDKFIIDFNSR